MGVDFKRSYESVFKSENFLFKLLFSIVLCVTGLYLLYVTSNIVLPYYLLFLLALCIYTGFSLDFMHNEIHGISPTLPTLKGNIPRYLKSGVKMITFIAVYTVCFSITALVLACVDIILVYLGLPFCGNNTGIDFILYGPLLMGLIVFSMLFNVAVCTYADNFRFKDSFNVKKLFWLLYCAKS